MEGSIFQKSLFCLHIFFFSFTLRDISYSQCLPSRFKKDIVKAATNGGFNPTHPIAIDDLQRVMTNINMEHKVSRTDIETIFHEIGGANMDGQVTMPAERFMRECF